jgi:hypothetical protein
MGMSSELRQNVVAAELAATIRESCLAMDEHRKACRRFNEPGQKRFWICDFGFWIENQMAPTVDSGRAHSCERRLRTFWPRWKTGNRAVAFIIGSGNGAAVTIAT